MTVVTFEAIVTDRSRVPDGNYREFSVFVTMLAEDDDDDTSLALSAFDVAHSVHAEPIGGMILSFRLIHSVI